MAGRANGSAPTGQGRGAREQAAGHGMPSHHTAAPYGAHAGAGALLDRLDGVQRSGNGWRARCPSCGGRSRKVSVTDRDGVTLIYCFGGCQAVEVLQALGLGWADILPPRTWPQTPEDRRQARRAIRESGWSAALEVLALESKVVLFAARELHHTGGLEIEDGKRLAEAVKRIDHAANVLVEVRR